MSLSMRSLYCKCIRDHDFFFSVVVQLCNYINIIVEYGVFTHKYFKYTKENRKRLEKNFNAKCKDKKFYSIDEYYNV